MNPATKDARSKPAKPCRNVYQPLMLRIYMLWIIDELLCVFANIHFLRETSELLDNINQERYYRVFRREAHDYDMVLRWRFRSVFMRDPKRTSTNWRGYTSSDWLYRPQSSSTNTFGLVMVTPVPSMPYDQNCIIVNEWARSMMF